MVPYIRKSFYKHYKEGMKYLCDESWNIEKLIEDSNEYNSIEDVPIDDFGFYNNEMDDFGDYDKVYQYAMDMTQKELDQAVEGMYHNLND